MITFDLPTRRKDNKGWGKEIMEPIDVNKHILVANGGVSIDKRTWAAKDLIKRIKERAIYINDDINPNFLGLRMKDITLLFTTDNINLN